MLTRSRKKFVTWIALFAVIFAVLMPATSSFARSLTYSDIVALGGICTTAHNAGDPTVPGDRTALRGHCAFCILGAPLAAGHRMDALLTTLDTPAVARHLPRNDALPRDAVAFHPLNPRAPPRMI